MVAICLQVVRLADSASGVKTRSYGAMWAPMDGGRYGSMVGRAGERWKGEVAVEGRVDQAREGDVLWRRIIGRSLEG